VGGAHK